MIRPLTYVSNHPRRRFQDVSAPLQDFRARTADHGPMRKPPHLWFLDGLLVTVTVLLLLHVLEPGTIEVPMPCHAPPTDETETMIPFA